MSYAVKARTARKAHLCDGCHWTPSLRGIPTILPGHRYLIHTAFPGSEVNQSHRPYTNTQCVNLPSLKGGASRQAGAWRRAVPARRMFRAAFTSAWAMCPHATHRNLA